MYWNSMCISSVFSILRWYQILVFPCLQDFFFKLESKDGVVCLIWLHWVLVAAWGLFRKIKKIVFRKTILTSSIRWMTGPTVATLTWNTALCETTTIRAAAPMLKESQFRKAMCCKDPFICHSGKGRTVESANMASVRTVWGQRVFWWWNSSVFSLWWQLYTSVPVKTLGTIYMHAHMGQFLCKQFFFFLKGERGHFLKTSAFGPII